MNVGELRKHIEECGLDDEAAVILIEVGQMDSLGEAVDAGVGGSTDGLIFVIEAPAGKFFPDG